MKLFGFATLHRATFILIISSSIAWRESYIIASSSVRHGFSIILYTTSYTFRFWGK